MLIATIPHNEQMPLGGRKPHEKSLNSRPNTLAENEANLSVQINGNEI
jgi:hypothetical protein